MARRRVGALFFERFELLDAFGPLEMFGALPEHFEIVTIGERGPSIASTQGPRVVIERSFGDAEQMDLLLVPGGIGTRVETENEALLGFLGAQAPNLEILASVCTGAALLARAGLLDGRRATSNKMVFPWVVTQGPRTTWVPEARWVEDGDVFTASGVAAGIDMALAVIARLVGPDLATRVAHGTEYDWHRDASWDPFAKLHGLV
ncbi:DJ-1/PfpI family protein [Myxococcota bacterium]|nr:DJ-1/PfpI family protein [Myxococcota bacterium]MCZ7619802.1 DJ-1/PfpI family protein [Myxococcota bacterium]